MQATAAIRSERHLVIVARASAGPGPTEVRVGQRIPLAPPFGGVFVAWGAPAVVDDWLNRTERPALHEVLRESLAAIRGRGYSVERFMPAMVRFVPRARGTER